jgi:hypothetical protein
VSRIRTRVVAPAGLIALTLALTVTVGPVFARGSFVGNLHTVRFVATTIPANGDVNPYGTFVVPSTVGNLVQGNILVSNFNDSGNAQGTGSTIVEISPSGNQRLFAQIDASTLPGACPGGVGLTTALVALRSGWVIVGSLPTQTGLSSEAQAGCLIVLNAEGSPVETIPGPKINGPWDMTAADFGDSAVLFVTNVLIGTLAANGAVVNGGTVLRIRLEISGDGAPAVESERVIGSGFPERTDPAALVIGPTGVGLGADGTLYVADSLDNRIAAIPNALSRDSSAGAGQTVFAGGDLNDPLGLAIAPNGDILTVNGNDGNLVETTPGGAHAATVTLDTTGSPPGAGVLFGLAADVDHDAVYFVDDGNNTLEILR